MIGLELKPEEEKLIKAYTEVHGLSISEFAKKSMLEKIEDEYDLKCYEDSIEEYRKNPVTYSLEEVERELGL